MPNLYITNSTTTTTVGLTNERKTTPSLVVTCGNTTYYGGLTTCADWATSPNKIVVTSGATTYYTMAPAKGTKFVNFITPRECPITEGAIRAVCCEGHIGTQDSKKEGLVLFNKTEHGAIGNSTLTAANEGLVTALLENKDDTTITKTCLWAPSRGHTHDTSIVLDDSFAYCFGCCSIPKTNHKGVCVYCNYQSAPDCIYVGCMCSSTKGNVPYEYLYANGTNDNRSRSVFCMIACCTSPMGTWPAGNVSVNDLYEYDGYPFNAIANGPISSAVGCGHMERWSAGEPALQHSHYIQPNTTFALVACYDYGIGMPWFSINMKCYDNDIDKLPRGTILFTNCPETCFDSRCWYVDGQSYFYPYRNMGWGCNRFLGDCRAMFCYAPVSYNGDYARYDNDIEFKNMGMFPVTCSGSVGNCVYCPILNTWHSHPYPSGNKIYVCGVTGDGRGTSAVKVAAAGMNKLVHC